MAMFSWTGYLHLWHDWTTYTTCRWTFLLAVVHWTQYEILSALEPYILFCDDNIFSQLGGSAKGSKSCKQKEHDFTSSLHYLLHVFSFYAHSQISKNQLLASSFMYDLCPSPPSTCLTVCLSVCQAEWLGSLMTDFHEKWNLTIFQNSINKTQVSLHSDNNNRSFTSIPM
jgi:hypothetical protein